MSTENFYSGMEDEKRGKCAAISCFGAVKTLLQSYYSVRCAWQFSAMIIERFRETRYAGGRPGERGAGE
jgi:hypothetical protein